MMKNRSFLQSYWHSPGSIFLLGYLPVFILLLILVLLHSKVVVHVTMNSFHTPFLDILMKYWTWLGDGILLVILIPVLLLISFRYSLTVLTAFILSGLGVQFFKRVFFSDFPRPVKYFEIIRSNYELYLVPGVEMNAWYSFPSGHTATAFALFFALALLTRSKIGQAGLLILAIGVGYSRVYLSLHFLMDVVAGSLLGMVMGWIAWRLFRDIDRKWMDLSLNNILRR
jgi:membrane-associated phospholipid phosphatase